MTDTITDSFCERCGTRFAFDKTAKPRRARLGRVRVLTRGLTTFVANDGLPMAEAMAAARNDEERADLSRQLDAFHKTFNFCMTCRQYTCPSCWNEAAGECLTCAPDLTREVLPAAFPDLPVDGPSAGRNGEAQEAVAATSWPTIDLDRTGSGAPPADVTAAPTADGGALPGAPADLDAAAAAAAAAPDSPATPAPAHPAPASPAPAHQPTTDSGDDASATLVPAAELTPDELTEIEGALALARAETRHAQADTAPDAADAATAHDAAPAADAATAPEAAPAADAAAAPAAAPDQAAAVTPADQAPGEPEPTLAAATLAASPEPGPAPAAPTTEASPQPSAAEPAAKPAADAAAPADDAAAARTETRRLLRRFRPARDAAPAAVRPVVAPDGAPTAPTPEPTPAGPAPSAAPQVPDAPAQVPPRPRIDAVEQPTWQMVAPDVPAPAAPEGPGTGVPEPSEGGVGSPAAWPSASAWPPPPAATSRAPGADASPWAARLAASRPDGGGVWAASSREVLGAPAGSGATPAIQACVSCGLSLSATARFCRRCGARQG